MAHTYPPVFLAFNISSIGERRAAYDALDPQALEPGTAYRLT